MVEPSNFTLYTPHDPPLYKQTQFPPMPGGTGPQGRGTRGTCARRSQFGGPIVQNEPNLPAAARGTRPGGVGHGANMQNEPNFRRPWAGRGRQGRGTRGRKVRNEANRPLGRCRAGRPTHEEPRGNRAKRTQFPPAAGGTGRGGVGRGANVRNEANFRRRRVGRGCKGHGTEQIMQNEETIASIPGS